MLFPMWMLMSFFTADGGGVPGKDAGIDRAIMTGIGLTMIEPRLFTDKFHPVGERTTKTGAGKDMNGTNAAYPIAMQRKTGEAGKEISIGRKKITGA
jgi:hypothetical protein